MSGARRVKSSHPSFQKLVLVDEAMLTELSAKCFHRENDAGAAGISEAEQELRKYNPTMRAMAGHYEGMREALALSPTAAHRDASGMDSTDETRLAKYEANRYRLGKLAGTGEKAMPDPEVAGGSTAPTPPTPHVEVAAEVAEADDPEDADAGATTRTKTASTSTIPKQHLSKYRQLMQHLSNSTAKVLEASSHGELIVGGKILRGTSYSDVLRSLFVNSKFAVPGLPEAVTALHAAGVPNKMLGSQRAKRIHEIIDHNEHTAASGASTIAAHSGQTGSGGMFVDVVGRKCKFMRIY